VSSPLMPPERKRSFYRTMVGAVVPSLCLIVRKEAPSASIRISLARNTYPAGSERDFRNRDQFVLLGSVEDQLSGNSHTDIDASQLVTFTLRHATSNRGGA